MSESSTAYEPGGSLGCALILLIMIGVLGTLGFLTISKIQAQTERFEQKECKILEDEVFDQIGTRSVRRLVCVFHDTIENNTCYLYDNSIFCLKTEK